MQKILTAFAIIIILFGFTETVNPPTGNWYQQFMPGIGNRNITDIFFLDSLTGYAVTNNLLPNDTGYILKTTNSGNNWSINFTSNKNFKKIIFVDFNTGFASGGSGGGTAYLTKTTNAGNNWLPVNTPSATSWLDMAVLNNNTLWVVDNDGLVGGVFYTANGGTSWTQQLALGNQNPDHIYMFNTRIGFVAKNTSSSYTMRTTDSGLNWSPVINKGFTDMFFSDSLKGWSAFDSVRTTTNGGINWTNQLLPYGGIISPFSQLTRFSFLNQDTAWGIGGYVVYPNNQVRGILYRTINGGVNWLFQVPDTTIHIAQYYYVKFNGKYSGWAYYSSSFGIHTTTGGDPVWLTGIQQIGESIPNNFILYQNYPNPFNPKTIIKFDVKRQAANVKLIVFNIMGQEITVLVNQKQGAGTYQVDFSGNNIASGVYFYSLIIDGTVTDTKKMILVK